MNGYEPHRASDRREALPPDITLGALSLWVGRSKGAVWLDMALTIRDRDRQIAEHDGPLIQRRDLEAFESALAGFEENGEGELYLGSEGSTFAITLTRYARADANYCKVTLRQSSFSQTVSFGLSRGDIASALSGMRAVLERLDRDEQDRWRPSPESLGPARDRNAAGAQNCGRAAVASPAAAPIAESWDAGLGEGEDVAFAYVVDGVGWFHVEVRVGEAESGFGGSSWASDTMGDLLRAALSLLAGGQRAEVVCDAEPFLTRVEFERVQLRAEHPADGSASRIEYGCWIRIRELDDCTQEPGALEFEALCRSPRAVAEAIYAMAVPHFASHARSDYLTLVALEGALAAVNSAEQQARAKG